MRLTKNVTSIFDPRTDKLFVFCAEIFEMKSHLWTLFPPLGCSRKLKELN